MKKNKISSKNGAGKKDKNFKIKNMEEEKIDNQENNTIREENNLKEEKYESENMNENFVVSDDENNVRYNEDDILDNNVELDEKMKNKIAEFVRQPAYQDMKASDIAYLFAVPKNKKGEFSRLIQELEEEGRIHISKKGKITSMKKANLVRGTFSMTKRNFGFVIPDDETMEDIFISANDKDTAMNGDTVIVKIKKESSSKRRCEGSVEKVIARANEKIVGTFQASEKFGFVEPDNKKISQDIFIPERFFNGAKNNDKVVVKINVWPTTVKSPEGEVIEVLGQVGERYVEIDSIVRAHDLPDSFPQDVMESLASIPDEVKESEIKGRLDLRDEMIFTIDGDDSKDFDDAISVRKLENGNYYLGVHIADVTHYVKENSKLDKEALKRATSVYLVDKVIPMLPKKLSNGICSLNPGVDRLALSILMEINHEGKVENYKIKNTVINSKARLTYHKVSEMIENNDEELIKEYEYVIDDLRTGAELAQILRKRRDKRGAIDFDFDESKIMLDENGMVRDIEPYERRVSNKMIEEFMLVSNETIAEHYYWLETPFVYRIHEQPDSERMLRLRSFLNEFGYRLGHSDNIRPKVIQNILSQLDGKPEKNAISAIILRSLRQAKYAPTCDGHFGLAAKYYCHFTSPIRRYPDLQIHRIIKENISGKLDSKRTRHYRDIVENVSVISSTQERKAELAERDVDDYYKAVFMEDKIGEVYEGEISGITSFGMFVELKNSVEGMVRLNTLADHYEFIEDKLMLKGQHTGEILRVGDLVKIEVENVSVAMREIDFKLLEKLNKKDN